MRFTSVTGYLLPEDESAPKIWLGAVSVVLVLVRGVGFYFGFTSIFLLATNAVPESHLGRMNGVAMTLSSSMKFAGPAIMSPLFAWSIDESRAHVEAPAEYRPFPINHYFTFLLCGFFMVVGAFLVKKVPKRLAVARKSVIDRRMQQDIASGKSTPMASQSPSLASAKEIVKEERVK